MRRDPQGVRFEMKLWYVVAIAKIRKSRNFGGG